MRTPVYVFSVAILALLIVPAIILAVPMPAGSKNEVAVVVDLREQMLDQTVLVSAAGGHGSGVVIGPRTILTVAHVASNAPEFDVEFRDGRVIKARPLWVGSDEFDAAVLILDEPVGTVPAKLSCAAPISGERLTAVGNPLEGRWVETQLMVGSNRVIEGKEFKTLVIGFLIPGMSGGPVFNDRGEVVGLSQSIRLLPLGRGATITGMALITSGTSLCLAGLG